MQAGGGARGCEGLGLAVYMKGVIWGVGGGAGGCGVGAEVALGEGDGEGRIGGEVEGWITFAPVSGWSVSEAIGVNGAGGGLLYHSNVHWSGGARPVDLFICHLCGLKFEPDGRATVYLSIEVNILASDSPQHWRRQSIAVIHRAILRSGMCRCRVSSLACRCGEVLDFRRSLRMVPW